MAQILTRDQAVIVSGFTGKIACPFDWLHKDVERRLGRPVFTHEFAIPAIADAIKEAYRADFLAMCATEQPK